MVGVVTAEATDSLDVVCLNCGSSSVKGARYRVDGGGEALAARLDVLDARPAVQRGLAVNQADRKANDIKDPKIAAVLFNQKARD